MTYYILQIMNTSIYVELIKIKINTQYIINYKRFKHKYIMTAIEKGINFKTTSVRTSINVYNFMQKYHSLIKIILTK